MKVSLRKRKKIKKKENGGEKEGIRDKEDERVEGKNEKREEKKERASHLQPREGSDRFFHNLLSSLNSMMNTAIIMVISRENQIWMNRLKKKFCVFSRQGILV